MLGESNIEGTYHLINVQHVRQQGVVSANNKMSASSLYRDCLALTTKRFEYMRCNSSGPVVFGKTFSEFISIPGCFPRRRKGVVLLKSKDTKNINTVYICAKNEDK